MKCDVIDASILDGCTQPILNGFVLDKLPGYQVFYKPETIHYENVNKSVLNPITFYLENDDYKEFNFNGETLPFKLQMIKL